MKIPLVDLDAQHAPIRSEIDRAVQAVATRGDFVLGAAVSRFEEDFARFIGVRRAVGVASGTDAVEIAVRACGIGPGDEVIVPANTFVATALGVIRAGATPVFVDCEQRTHLIDFDLAAAAVGPRTKAVVPVHLFGRMVSSSRLRRFGSEHGVVVIEDAAQAHGARDDGGAAGAIGAAASWSFYPGKNLGAWGDAGAVTSNDDETAARAAAFRNYGSPRKYEHPEFGVNSRLDSIQAAILGVKLAYLERWNGERRRLAARYRECLAQVRGVTIPEDPGGQAHVWHLFVVRVPGRDRVLDRLRSEGIGAAIHYPAPVPFLGAVGAPARPGDYPVAERLSREILSLPLYPGMPEAAVEEVAASLERALAA